MLKSVRVLPPFSKNLPPAANIPSNISAGKSQLKWQKVWALSHIHRDAFLPTPPAQICLIMPIKRKPIIKAGPTQLNSVVLPFNLLIYTHSRLLSSPYLLDFLQISARVGFLKKPSSAPLNFIQYGLAGQFFLLGRLWFYYLPRSIPVENLLQVFLGCPLPLGDFSGRHHPSAILRAQTNHRPHRIMGSGC